MLLYALLLIANGAPVVASIILRDRLSFPVDSGLCLFDGRQLFGPRKTLRGVIFACFVTPLAALILGLSWHVGLLIAAGAMAGDLLSSFVKRRIGVKPHGPALGLDQIPEALLPLLWVKAEFALDALDIVVIVMGFCVTEWCLSYLVDRFNLLRIKKG